jgi:outer membrane lipoprotein-sorting protein
MKKLLAAPLFVLVVISVSQGQSRLTLEQVFAKMDAVAKTFKSAQADLERTQVTVVANLNEKDVAWGKFYYARKEKEPRIKVEMTKPAQEMALIDKGKFQLYRPKLKQVQEADLSQRKETVEQWMALAFGQTSEDLKKNYTVSLAGEETLDGQPTVILDLKPKTTNIKSVRMWMDQQKWVAVQLRITEVSDDYFVWKYSNIKLNQNIPDSIFSLNLPKDVKIQKL